MNEGRGRPHFTGKAQSDFVALALDVAIGVDDQLDRDDLARFAVDGAQHPTHAARPQLITKNEAIQRRHQLGRQVVVVAVPHRHGLLLAAACGTQWSSGGAPPDQKPA